jgi:hypothetical protein
MHAEPDSRVCAAAFDQCDEIVGDGDGFVREREHEFSGN